MTHVLDPLIGYLDQKPTEGCGCEICEGCREGLRILVAAREGRQSEDLEIACQRAGTNGYQRGRAEGRREERERLVDIGDEMAAMLDMATSLSDIDSEGAVAELLAEWRSARGDHWRGGEG